MHTFAAFLHTLQGAWWHILTPPVRSDSSSMGSSESQGTVAKAPPAAAASAISGRFRPGIATRVALGFAAIAVTILAANIITQQSTRAARDHMRQLVVEHEPIMRATESLAGAISVYERVVL